MFTLLLWWFGILFVMVLSWVRYLLLVCFGFDMVWLCLI